METVVDTLAICMAGEFEIKGLDEVEKMLRGYAGSVPQAVNRALNRIALRVRNDAVNNAPISPMQKQKDKEMKLWRPASNERLRRTVSALDQSVMQWESAGNAPRRRPTSRGGLFLTGRRRR